jgi:dTDP-4-dehydrorhamnose 3,5-epimerase
MSLTVKKLAIPEVLLIESPVFKDNRGKFLELFKHSDFFEAGIKGEFLQDNLAYSKKGVLRGMHYQLAPKAQAKIVRAVKGTIYDVVADVRKGSPTFGQWVGAELSEDNNLAIYVPEGFAHGFMCLSEESYVVYKMTNNEYSPESERGIAWNDPDLKINWPIAQPILSSKDSNAPFLKDVEVFN